MILYVGSEDAGYFIKSVAKEKSQELKFISANPHIENQIQQIFNFSPQFMIFEISQYTDDSEIIVDRILSCARAKKSKIIILAPGYSPESNICHKFNEAGEDVAFILAGDMGHQKEQLVKALAGVKLVIDNDDYDEAVIQAIANSKKIGITGCCHRIGTTTQCLQLIKYLQFKGYKACYLQVNSNKYVETLNQYYQTIHDEYLGKVQFENVDLYYKQEHLPEILQQDFDYYIFDFGTYSDTDFNKTSFLEKDIRIFCLGSKANEIPYTNDVIRSEYYKDSIYIYNFSADAERPDILELMDERAVQTYFSEYAPDPFVLSKTEVFEKILPVENISEDKNVKKKKGFFKKWA